MQPFFIEHPSFSSGWGSRLRQAIVLQHLIERRQCPRPSVSIPGRLRSSPRNSAAAATARGAHAYLSLCQLSFYISPLFFYLSTSSVNLHARSDLQFRVERMQPFFIEHPSFSSGWGSRLRQAIVLQHLIERRQCPSPSVSIPGTPPRRRRPVARTRSRENLACKLLGSPYRNGSPELSSCHTSTASFRAQATTATLRFFRLAILRKVCPNGPRYCPRCCAACTSSQRACALPCLVI